MAKNKTAFSDYIAGQKAKGEQLAATLRSMGLPNGSLVVPLHSQDDDDGRVLLKGSAPTEIPGLPLKVQAISVGAATPKSWRCRIDGPGLQLRNKTAILTRLDAPYPLFTGILETPLVDLTLSLVRLPVPLLNRPRLLSIEAKGGEED